MAHPTAPATTAIFRDAHELHVAIFHVSSTEENGGPLGTAACAFQKATGSLTFELATFASRSSTWA